jgi:hypothetical protein
MRMYYFGAKIINRGRAPIMPIFYFFRIYRPRCRCPARALAAVDDRLHTSGFLFEGGEHAEE